MGSNGIGQDLALTDQISLPGGISYFHLNDLLLPSAASIKELFVSIMSFLISRQCRRSLNKVCSCSKMGERDKLKAFIKKVVAANVGQTVGLLFDENFPAF